MSRAPSQTSPSSTRALQRHPRAAQAASASDKATASVFISLLPPALGRTVRHICTSAATDLPKHVTCPYTQQLRNALHCAAAANKTAPDPGVDKMPNGPRRRHNPKRIQRQKSPQRIQTKHRRRRGARERFKYMLFLCSAASPSHATRAGKNSQDISVTCHGRRPHQEICSRKPHSRLTHAEAPSTTAPAPEGPHDESWPLCRRKKRRSTPRASTSTARQQDNSWFKRRRILSAASLSRAVNIFQHWTAWPSKSVHVVQAVGGSAPGSSDMPAEIGSAPNRPAPQGLLHCVSPPAWPSRFSSSLLLAPTLSITPPLSSPPSLPT